MYFFLINLDKYRFQKFLVKRTKTKKNISNYFLRNQQVKQKIKKIMKKILTIMEIMKLKQNQNPKPNPNRNLKLRQKQNLNQIPQQIMKQKLKMNQKKLRTQKILWMMRLKMVKDLLLHRWL